MELNGISLKPQLKQLVWESTLKYIPSPIATCEV